MEKGGRKKYITGMEVAPENGKESSHSAHANGMNDLLYAFFWVIPRHLNFICQHIGTLCPFHFHTWVATYQPMKMEQCLKCHIKFRCRGITQKKAHSIQNTAKV